MHGREPFSYAYDPRSSASVARFNKMRRVGQRTTRNCSISRFFDRVCNVITKLTFHKVRVLTVLAAPLHGLQAFLSVGADKIHYFELALEIVNEAP